MKRFITAVLTVATVLMAMALPAEASESGRWITKTFKDVYDMENYDGFCRHFGTKMEGIKVTK